MPVPAQLAANSFAPTLAAEIDAIVDHVNEHHGDTVALVALGAAMQANATARILSVNRTGATVEAGSPLERTSLAFAKPVTSAQEFQAAMFTALSRAREAAGDTVALTSLERELARDAIPMHQTHVVSSRPVTPTILEVVLGGLDQFTLLGPDTFAYALVTNDGCPINPALTMSEYLERDETSPVRGAYYTVRSWDPERSEATLWVVLHQAEDGVAAWMASARPGDQLLLWGPRSAFSRPPEADHLVLVVDETGLAAAAAIIEEVPSAVVIELVAETGGPEHRPPMPSHGGLTVHWLDRDGITPGTGTALLDAVARIDMQMGTWAAFGGAESHQTSTVRRLLRDERQLLANRVSMTGYWRFQEYPRP